jgi:hypothetical protein
VDVLCLQHEFEIFGGPCGRLVLTVLRNLRMPVVTTLHTILSDPSAEHKRALQEVIKLSARVVSMAEKGIEFLRDIYGTPLDKIDLIPHGISDGPFADPNYYKDKFVWRGVPSCSPLAFSRQTRASKTYSTHFQRSYAIFRMSFT